MNSFINSHIILQVFSGGVCTLPWVLQSQAQYLYLCMSNIFRITFSHALAQTHSFLFSCDKGSVRIYARLHSLH